MELINLELQKLLKFNQYTNRLNNNQGPVLISGLSDVGMINIIDSTYKSLKKPICIITYNELQAKKIYNDFKVFSPNVLFFPKKDIVVYDYITESKELLYDRIEVLNKIYEKNAPIIITTIEAIMQNIIPKDILYKNILEFKIGNTYNLEKVKEKLIKLGYQRTEMVEGKGQFSVRGGIIDISIFENSGIRIEFWGDEVDSIRKFNISTQRSSDTIEKITIYPSCEYILEKTESEVCSEILKNKYTKFQQENLKYDIELINSGNYISKIEKYINSFYSNTQNLLDYLSDEYILFLDEINKIKVRNENILNDNKSLIEDLVQKDKIIPEAIIKLKSYNELEYCMANKQIAYVEKQDFNSTIQAEKYTFKFREVNYHKGNIQNFIQDIKNNKEKKIIILCSEQERAKKISNILSDENIRYKYMENDYNYENLDENVIITIGKVSSGFESYDLNLLLMDANELIDTEKKKNRILNKAFKEGEKIIYADLKVGDYVVHKIHGIGQFIGVNTITADKITKDYIKINYKGEDILYIPTNQLDNIRKYIGGGEKVPKINKLGGKEWENTKNKVKNNLREVAQELIELYAKRQNNIGYMFSKDTIWQKQFEDSFPYNETEDQLRCIEEVKKDMESSKIMDRLLCGDVGYGKTEVAIRAAFKAVMDQKQVAYLVPTTVLANQQYESFKERMKDFPIEIEVLNRFRTKKEQEKIIKKLKLGQIDIIIGTQRILSKDIDLKELGLLIIDEEHRFGVKDKEKIKEYKTNVDVLTMTATPIPRTLHMSILGVRDMSVIYEPPQNRKPVQTYVLEYDTEIIKEAITKELERKGQIFYLFNNVEKIQAKSEELANLVPEARIAFAHGKMSGNELEDIMMNFVNKDIDILVCTTILESGIDIPNANTIIVENADRLGLAQLYQIRGRVGRSGIQAHAYITYKRNKILTEVSDKRLKAIREFTEFGSGFKIAMRDLEIRGAGSILGEIQHGHMEQVGYDTYCNLLDEVIKEMKGIQVEQIIDVQIDLNISSYIPDEYINIPSQKIEVYQNIALCKNEEDIQNVIDEIIDRYGDMPKELENLFEISRIKELCRKLFIVKLTQNKDKIVFSFDVNKFNFEIVDKAIKVYKNKIKFSPGNRPYITYELDKSSNDKILKEIKGFLLLMKGK